MTTGYAVMVFVGVALVSFWLGTEFGVRAVLQYLSRNPELAMKLAVAATLKGAKDNGAKKEEIKKE